MATQEEQLREFHGRNQETTKVWQGLIGLIANGKHKQTYSYTEVATLLTYFSDVASGNKTADEVLEEFKGA